MADGTADTLDIVTVVDAKEAINSKPTSTNVDRQLQRLVSAVSRRIDKLCGPVVARTNTSELYDGQDRRGYARSFLRPRQTPVYAVASVIEYVSTTGTTLTAETNASKPSNGYLLDSDGLHSVKLWRRASGGDSSFPCGRRNIALTYQAGRYLTTEDVDEPFVSACLQIVRRMYEREAAGWQRNPNPVDAIDVFGGDGRPSFYRAVDPVIRELLADQLLPPQVSGGG